MNNNNQGERGFVLMTSLIVIVIMTGLIMGFLDQVRTEQNIGGNDLDYTNAFYAAEAGLEKQNSDLSKLFQASIFPPQAAIDAIELAVERPALPNVTYTEYTITGGQQAFLSAAITAAVTTVPVVSTANWPTTGYFMVGSEELTYTGLTATTFTGVVRGANGTAAAPHANNSQVSRSRVITVAEGASAGLFAQVIPFDLTVTAQAGRGAEARLSREVQVALVPVFQFGVFSDSDLAFHAGNNFNFGGRVHTNGNLFLSQNAGSILTLSQKVSVVGEVVRREMNNGLVNPTAGVVNSTGRVRLITSPLNFRDLTMGEGSVNAGLTSPANPLWSTISLTTYNGNVLSGATGAKPLTLPFAGGGANPIEIVRRPPAGEDPNGILGQSRLYNQASVRVLLSDCAADLAGGVGYPLNAGLGGFAPASGIPFAMTIANDPNYTDPSGAQYGANSPAIDGFIKVERQLADGTYEDVTMALLNLGISTADPDAVLRFQRLDPGAAPPSTVATEYWEMKLYDTREGERRQFITPLGGTETNMSQLGIMGLVELDVTNLRRWLEGVAAPFNAPPFDTGPNTFNNGGYIFYFSDRRGNRATAGYETGEFGFEDIINPLSITGTPNRTLDPGEDINGSGFLDEYGAFLPLATPCAGAPAPRVPEPPTPPPTSPPLSIDIWNTRFNTNKATRSKVHYFRRGIRLINGCGSNLPDPGFTVASENPVYVQGDYNADSDPLVPCASQPSSPMVFPPPPGQLNLPPGAAGFGGAPGVTHSFAAVIADTVKLLSNSWNDDNSFVTPQTFTPSRIASNTWYRMAIATGKTLTSPHPGAATVPIDFDFGGDGGVHNLFQATEVWLFSSLNYLGSLVSLYHSGQAVGQLKCACGGVYSQPARRNFTFDAEFLVPSQLPPGTPRFRDINNLSFRQTIQATP